MRIDFDLEISALKDGLTQFWQLAAEKVTLLETGHMIRLRDHRYLP